METFGTRLKRLRKENDVTQAALAEYIGVVASAIGKYECIQDAYPSVESLIKISEFFNVSIDYLLKGTEPQPSIRNNISGSLSNSSFVQANNGAIVYNGGLNYSVSPEALELLKIYESLSGRERIQLLNSAIDLEKGGSNEGST